MTNTIQHHIDTLVAGQDLNATDAEHAFQIIMNGGATPAQMAAFLVALRMKGETATELLAGARVMRAKMVVFNAPEGAVDSCGTGGDAKGTLNVSTAVAIVVAACGVPVAKHGNRSVSSKSGSSDVLQALGVDVNAPMGCLEAAINNPKCRIAFLMAPRFHTAARHVAPVRKEIGLRTIFNLLGPLCNPAQPKFQVIGVYDPKWLRPMAEVLKELGVEHAWVVHGADGLDELSTTGESHVVALNNGSISEFTVSPEDVDLPRTTLDKLIGGNAEFNARALSQLLDGATEPYRDIVLLNAASVLLVAGKVKDLKEGVALAVDAIDSGRAKEALALLVSYASENENIRNAQNPT